MRYNLSGLLACGDTHIYWWPPTKNTPHILVTATWYDFATWRRQLTRPSAQWSQYNNGIFRKVWHNSTFHRPITNRSTSDPRRFSGQIGCKGRTNFPATTPDISASLRAIGCAGRTHSPAASPDLCSSPDNQLPRTGSLASSSTGPPCASSPTD